MQSKRPCVLFVAGDPGGAYALAPVIEQLNIEDEYDVQVLGYIQAAKVFRQYYFSVVEIAAVSTDDDVIAWLSTIKPDVVVTASSSNQFNLEKKFIAGAKNRSIPCLSVLDFWSNYSQRFSEEEKDLQYLPDKVAVIDEFAYKEMCVEGFPKDHLVITGQPAFDAYLEMHKNTYFSAIKRTREKYFGDADKVVLFISQPFAELFGEDHSNPLYPGYTQQTIFKELLHTLENIAVENNCRIALGLMPHMRERSAWWEYFDSEVVDIKLAEYDSFSKVTLTADMVVGMTSTMLVKTAILGILTVSLQLGSFPKKCFDMERFGIARVIYRKQSLEGFFNSALCGESKIENPNKLELDGKSTENVIQLIKTLLVEHQGEIIDVE